MARPRKESITPEVSMEVSSKGSEPFNIVTTVDAIASTPLIQQVTANGEIHGLIGELSNDSRESDMEKLNPKIRQECERQRQEDRRIVKARYINMRYPTKRLEKAYCRWPGDRIQKWRLIPNHVYDLPMGFINEVNGTKLAQRKREEGGQGSSSVDKADPAVTGYIQEYQLVPVSF